ncbi:MAG TPA: MlaD family protein [Bryobacteraceae bacterium]|nr:MlaD family protein [Bryobacteraceae bacterium]
MPSQTRVGWARLRVGVLAVIGMVILAVVIVLITGNSNFFTSQAKVYTYLNDAAALQTGAPVNLDGIPIGKVSQIILSGSKDPSRLVKIELQVREADLKDIPSDSRTSISAANVLGTKFINIKSGKSETTVKAGQELPSLNTAEFEDVVQQGYAILTSLQGIVQRVDRIVGLVENGQGSIGKLLVDETLYNHVLQIVDEVNKLAMALDNDKGTLGKLIYDREIYDQAQGTLKRMDELIQGLQEGQGSAGKFLKDPALYNELQHTTEDLHKVVTDLNEGKGTAGKLLKSDDLANQLHDTIARIDLVIDKVNSGQGTIGQLLVNGQLYDNLNGATRELHGLMKDFRSNPKKFLRIKLSLF